MVYRTGRRAKVGAAGRERPMPVWFPSGDHPIHPSECPVTEPRGGLMHQGGSRGVEAEGENVVLSISSE